VASQLIGRMSAATINCTQTVGSHAQACLLACRYSCRHSQRSQTHTSTQRTTRQGRRASVQYAVHTGDFDDLNDHGVDGDQGEDWGSLSPLRLDDAEVDKATAMSRMGSDSDAQLLEEYFKKLTYYVASEPEGEVITLSDAHTHTHTHTSRTRHTPTRHTCPLAHPPAPVRRIDAHV
jgi:hypothetical protein